MKPSTRLIPAIALVGALIAAAPLRAAEVRLAVIGDYGLAGRAAAKVAARVRKWRPAAVLTVGDNNYPDGSASTIDANVGRYYAAFIGNYAGAYGRGAAGNRFFPALGNHDWLADGAGPYLRYFHLPGNERYYDIGLGPVRVFVLDSDPSEPDGNGADSPQARWLRRGLARAKEPWKIVLFHHPPYSSGRHGSSRWMQWPFRKWGATAVISGHDHDYERIEIDGFPFFVNGLGGGPRRSFDRPIDGSVVRFAARHGAMRIDASEDRIAFRFITAEGKVIDTLTLPPESACERFFRGDHGVPRPLPAATDLSGL